MTKAPNESNRIEFESDSIRFDSFCSQFDSIRSQKNWIRFDSIRFVIRFELIRIKPDS